MPQTQSLWMGVVLQALARLGFPILHHSVTYMTFPLIQLFSYSYLECFSMQTGFAESWSVM